MLQKQELAVAGRNWGHAAVEGSTLVFTENGKTTFRVPLSDVGQVWTPPSDSCLLCHSKARTGHLCS